MASRQVKRVDGPVWDRRSAGIVVNKEAGEKTRPRSRPQVGQAPDCVSKVPSQVLRNEAGHSPSTEVGHARRKGGRGTAAQT